ncbi:MAG: ArsR/SmtB family transcription factor [Bradymonadia bacterium]
MSTEHTTPDHAHVTDVVLKRAARMFGAVSNPERLRLLECLRGGEACVSGLAEHLGEPVTTTSNRLQILARAGLVVKRREERHQYYRLADEHVVQLLDFALEHAQHTELY